MKTFTDGSRSAKFVKVFYLESFPLYGSTILSSKFSSKLALLSYIMKALKCKTLGAEFANYS